MSIRDLIPWTWGQKKNEERPRLENAMTTLQRDMNQLFDDFFGRFQQGFGLSSLAGGSLRSGLTPKVDLSESEKEVKVTVELPGLTEDDIDLSIHNDVLRIRGEKKEETEERKRNYFLRERSYGAFYREIPFWSEVDAKKVDAQFKKGILTICIPKVTDSSTTKRIAIKTG